MASRTDRGKIGRVLFNTWDPLGVKNQPHLSDVYDPYISQVADTLRRHTDAAELAGVLRWIEVERMGLKDVSGRIHQAARELMRVGRP
jgi:hypothetical protein